MLENMCSCLVVQEEDVLQTVCLAEPYPLVTFHPITEDQDCQGRE